MRVRAGVDVLISIVLLIAGSACTAAQRRALYTEHGGAARAKAPESFMVEGNVPRVRCYDGNPAISCSPEQATLAHCCANQGGVYRDPWGNVVAQ